MSMPLNPPCLDCLREFATPLLIGLALLLCGSRELSAQVEAEESETPLISRDSIRLNAAGAQRVLAAAEAQARTMKLHVNISVVDDGGHLIAFLRMDGARAGSIYTSQTKASSSALLRAETRPLPSAENVNPHLSLAVENAAAASGGKFTTLLGGVPLVVDGQVIGAVGVGGATGEQDREIARAGAAALVKAVSP